MTKKDPTVKRKKHELGRYQMSMKNIARLERKRIDLEECIASGNLPIDKNDLIVDKIDTEKRIEKLKQRARKEKEKIIQDIDRLYDLRYIQILESRYIYGKGWQEIAAEMGYAERWVYTLAEQAIHILIDTDETEL